MSLEAKKQALLNEYKGYLFEYLVALNLSVLYNIEAKFFQEISSDLQHMLRIQEEYIRENYPELIKDLPKLAVMLAGEIYKKLSLENVVSVDIVGKMVASPIVNEFAEADIIIVSKEKNYPISLKLSKNNAFVNTKSGGVKSFFEKYFPCVESEKFQRQLNAFVDEKFHETAFKMHELAGIEYPMHFKDWVAQGLSELPGELDSEYKAILHKLYYAIIFEVHKMFRSLNHTNNTLFKTGLMSLCGVGGCELIQATCFYRAKGENYIFDKNIIDSADLIKKDIEQLQVCDYRQNLAHFEIKFPSRVLQIRIKPMNKFTSASFKVNCSVKKI